MTALHARQPPETNPEERCPSCGLAVATPFCGACGEQRGSDRHYSLRHFTEEALETFTHADGRVARTVRLLVTRPGELTSAYLRGARRPYMAPLQLFLLTNLVFFVWVSFTQTDTFSTPLRFHINGTFYSDLATRLVDARLAARHTTLARYGEIFDHAAALDAKSLIILMVPLMTCVTALVTIPRQSSIVHHIVFALHFMTMVLLYLIALQTALAIVFLVAHLARIHPSPGAGELLATSALLLGIGAYARIALRRSYLLGATSSLLRAVAFTVLFMPVLFVYRAVLFLITFYTT